jgi:hypothetical protein
MQIFVSPMAWFAAICSSCLILPMISCKSVRSTASSEKIIGGSEFTGLPAVGMLALDGEVVCTATLVSRQKFLTAAHCVLPTAKQVRNENLDPGTVLDSKRFKFHVGPAFAGSEAYPVSDLRVHQKYDRDANNFDLAVGTLAAEAPIDPLPLFQGDVTALNGKTLYLIGYGNNVGGYHQSGKGIKRALDLTVRAVNDIKLRLEDPGKSACHADSGGPAFVKTAGGSYELVGVTSCGEPLCNGYSVYSRIDIARSFIGADHDRDTPSRPQSCGKIPENGMCEGNILRSCSQPDCFEAQVREEDCSKRPQGSCREIAHEKRAFCIDSSAKAVKFIVKKFRLGESGSSDTSPPAVDAAIYVDYKKIASGTPTDIRTDNKGEATGLVTVGKHTVVVLSKRGDTVVTGLPQTVEIGDDSEQTINLLVGEMPTRITARYPAAPSQALYLTGAGPLLGDWKKAYKMQRRAEDKWELFIGLALFHPMKVVLAADGDDIIDTSSVRWQKGANVVSHPSDPSIGYAANIEPQFE